MKIVIKTWGGGGGGGGVISREAVYHRNYSMFLLDLMVSSSGMQEFQSYIHTGSRFE